MGEIHESRLVEGRVVEVFEPWSRWDSLYIFEYLQKGYEYNSLYSPDIHRIIALLGGVLFSVVDPPCFEGLDIWVIYSVLHKEDRI